MNLFLSTQKMVGSSKEDHLTEFFAAALELNREFREAYADFVLRDYAEAKGWGRPGIESVDTQVSWTEEGCRPDMLLNLEGGKRIICEHKIEALETMGFSEEVDNHSLPQLERYLKLDVDGLVFVRSSWKSPSERVLTHRNYVKPKNLEHFLWRDFYPMLEAVSDPFINWLQEGFEELGFTPPDPIVRDLNDPDMIIRESNRRNFAKFWTGTESLAMELGWKPEKGSISQLYLKENERAMAPRIFISPNIAERFLIRATPSEAHPKDKILDAFNKAAAGLAIAPTIQSRTIPRAGGKVVVCDVSTTLKKIIAGATEPSEIEKNLYNFVGTFLRALIS